MAASAGIMTATTSLASAAIALAGAAPGLWIGLQVAPLICNDPADLQRPGLTCTRVARQPRPLPRNATAE